MSAPTAQIHSKFNNDFKAKYIEGLKKTYLGVLLSIELNSKTSKIKDFKTQIESLIQKAATEGKITIDGQEKDVTLTEQNGTYNVKFTEDDSKVEIKNTGDYTDTDLFALCAQHELTIGKDNKGNYVFGIKIEGIDERKSVTIGGPGNISIFPQHLSYVKETIDHLKKDSNPITELALATGTGKTFIELLVKYLPARLMGARYVSIAPDNSLVTQKRGDWKKLLSDADIYDIELDKISDKKGCSILSNEGLMDNWGEFLEVIGLQQLPNIIEALKIGDKNFKIKSGKINIDGKDFIISANKIQFDGKEYEIKNGKVKINNQEFEIDITKPISISFDEEHRVIEEELYKYRMELLSTLCPTLFLSATPSSDTYKRVQENGGLIKTLSLKDKMRSGAYGQLELKVHKNRKGDLVNNYIEELERAIIFKEKPEENKKSFYYESQTNLTNEELKKDIENYIFHNIQSVIGEPALVLAESDDLKDKLKKEVTYDIFKDESNNGNHSHTVSQKCDAVIDHLCDVYGGDKSVIISTVVKDVLDYKSAIYDYSAFRVMHGVIDNTLSCLTGLSRSELDEARFTDLEALVKRVKGKLNGVYNLREYVTEQGIKNDAIAGKIVEQMQLVIDILKTKKEDNIDLFERLIKNWNQDKKLHTMMPPSIPNKEDEIMKLFGIEEKKYEPLTFSLGKNDSIFQYLKNGYEINGNIQNIEKECNDALQELKTAEEARQEFYNGKIKPVKDNLRCAIPEYYHWNTLSCTLSEYSSDYFKKDYKLSDYDKQNYEKKLKEMQKQINLLESGQDYIQLTNEISNKKKDIFRKFSKIRQQFQQEKSYPLAKFREFADEYRCIEGDDKDIDALLRMGLCGNYVNHERIQGFNAIDLQHVVMLVDDKSNFINYPSQLIQGLGRLRCLNSARLSILFCHSCDKLKFDIELLQKGNYIDAYNKIMEENNKKSPEELGNEILKTIEKLIKDEVSTVIKENKQEKFKEIDDLATEVLDQVISSFDVVYNNKSHNAKEAKGYFVKVLNYVTSQVKKELENEGIVPGDIDIEHNIRGIKHEIENIESSDIKSKLQYIINKIGGNTQDKEKNSKQLKINGNITKKLIIKLYRLIRRLIGCRIQLGKDKIELEEKEKNDLNDKQKEFETKKLNLEAQIKIEKRQGFVGVMEKKSDVKEKEVTQDERGDIITKQRNKLMTDLKENEENNQNLLKKIKDGLDKLKTEKTKLQKIAEEKSQLEQYQTDLQKILSYQEDSPDYSNHYDDVVNKVLVCKSIVKNYDVGKVIWMGEIVEKFIKVINNDCYKKQYYTEHMNSCVKNPIFLELLSNIIMPLYNDGMLFKALEIIYLQADNQ